MAKKLGEKKPLRKTTPKKTVKKVTEKVVTSEVVASPKVAINKQQILRVVLYVIVFVVSFSLIDLFVQYLNNSYSVAVVNGVRISNKEFNDRLVKAYGASASQAIIDEELILQEGRSKGISVSKEQVDTEIASIEEQIGGKEALEQALVANNLTLNDLERQIKIKVIKTEVLKPTVEYNDESLKTFFDTNKEYLYEENAKFEDKKADVEAKYIEQQIDLKQTTWLNELRENSRIQNNITEKPSYGFLSTTINIVKNLYSQFTNK